MLHHGDRISYLPQNLSVLEEYALNSRHFSIVHIIVWVSFAVGPHVNLIILEGLEKHYA